MGQDDGGAAFPCHTNPRPGFLANAPQGMTMRDYFAAKAMQGFMSTFVEGDILQPDNVAKVAYECADAMLLARKVRP